MSFCGPPCRYAICLPSGLHAGRVFQSGSSSAPSNVVSFRGAAPAFASMTKMSQLSPRSGSLPRLLTKAIDLPSGDQRSEEHTSELQSLAYLVCRLLLEKKKKQTTLHT